MKTANFWRQRDAFRGSYTKYRNIEKRCIVSKDISCSGGHGHIRIYCARTPREISVRNLFTGIVCLGESIRTILSLCLGPLRCIEASVPNPACPCSLLRR